MSPWLLERDDGRCGKHRQILRHLNAARQIDAGTQARVLSELLGHRDSQSLSAYVRIATQPCARVLARYLRHDRPSHTLTRHVFVRMKSLAAGPAMNTKVTAESLAIGRRVLHRVTATAARRQRSHRPHLPRCTDVAVQVRRRSRGRGVASLPLSDLDADAVTRFLDHIELERSNSPATRNRRRAAIRGFFKHLLRNDLTHSLQYTRVLAIPARKKMRQRPATYLEAQDSRLIVSRQARPAHRDGWRDYTLLLFLYNCEPVSAKLPACAGTTCTWSLRARFACVGKGKEERLLPLWTETANALHRLRAASHSALITMRVFQPARPADDARRDRLCTYQACGFGSSNQPSAAAQAHHTSRAAAQLRRRAATVRDRCHGDPRLHRPCKCRHDGSLHHDQPADEARRHAGVLEEGGH